MDHLVPSIPALQNFFQHVWRKPQALLRNEDGIEFLDIQEYIGVLGWLSNMTLTWDKILVREEYHEAFDFIHTHKNSFVVGQPGIGKTYFLFYALVRLLGLGEAVAMQPLNGSPCYLLFREGGVTVHDIWDSTVLDAYKHRIWALCDANEYITLPAGVFTSTFHMRVVLTTPPSAKHWHAFRKHHRAKAFIMDIWSTEEVKRLATLLRLDVSRLIGLAEKWGGTPGTWIGCRTPSEELEIETTLCCRIGGAVQNCGAIVQGAKSLNFPAYAPSEFYFIRPKKDANTGNLIRYDCDVWIPSRTICDYLTDGLLLNNNQVKADFHTTLSRYPSMRASSDQIFERLFHDSIFRSRWFQCRWYSSSRMQLPTTLQLPSLPEVIPSTLDAPSTCAPPYYWRPVSTDFHGIDSVLVLEEEVYAFQCAIRSGHRSPIDGLKALGKYLVKDGRPCKPLRVIFVGEVEGQIASVADEYINLSLENEHITVGWMAVAASTTGVTFNLQRP